MKKTISKNSGKKDKIPQKNNNDDPKLIEKILAIIFIIIYLILLALVAIPGYDRYIGMPKEFFK